MAGRADVHPTRGPGALQPRPSSLEYAPYLSTGAPCFALAANASAQTSDAALAAKYAPGGGGFLNITGATAASYTTPAVFFLDDGDVTDSGAQYRVVVTNSQGTNTSNAATLTVTPAVLTGFTQVSAGFRHVLALRSDGSVWSWGDNSYGQVGRSCTTCSPRPVNGLTGTFTQVLARGDTSFALRSDGTVWAWGLDDQGQLGNGGTSPDSCNVPGTFAALTCSLVPRQVTGLDNVVAVSAGWRHSMALKRDGTVWTWGSDFYGQRGDGSASAATPKRCERSSRVARCIPASTSMAKRARRPCRRPTYVSCPSCQSSWPTCGSWAPRPNRSLPLSSR